MTDTEKPIQIPAGSEPKTSKPSKTIFILVLVSEKEKLLLSPLGHYKNINTHQQITSLQLRTQKSTAYSGISS